MLRARKEGISRGLKPEFMATGDVRDKSRTYLRGKSNNKFQRQKQQQIPEAKATADSRSRNESKFPRQKQEEIPEAKATANS
jgi:hypothetical protein